MSDSTATILLGFIIVTLGYLLAGTFGAAIAFGSFLICSCLSDLMTHLQGISYKLDELKKSFDKITNQKLDSCNE